MINELLKEELKTVNDREQEGFKINSLQSADWAMRKLQAIEKHDQEVKEAAQAELIKQLLGGIVNLLKMNLVENISTDC
ncbi:hypothetical protein [Lactiplantibacillus plantarum]|uniref:hypothetical protein n=1 Tax=Lactiplantibacillus plantarum TaxID=1590 RepID=UPI002307B58B|nr:hypothetical protein [Lactiplantibacillus plantarum]WCE42341.1 hypothetical protein PGB25_09015 [Lactiplantibacillus plantarum]